MEKLKQKLSSRKLWAAIASALLCVMAAFFGEELTPEVVEVLKYAVAACMTYIFGEGAVDVARMIAEAIKEKYAIPSVADIVSDIKAAEASSESVDSPAEN